jgi:hypothetical protein
MIPITPSNKKEKRLPEVSESGIKNKPYMVSKDGYILLSNGDYMYLPIHYPFDNASIPKIFKFLFDVFKIEFFQYKSLSFLVHDYLYNYRGYRVGKKYVYKPVSRLFADQEMRYQMRLQKYSEHKIFIFFLAVRLFGWWHFGKN